MLSSTKCVLPRTHFIHINVRKLLPEVYLHFLLRTVVLYSSHSRNFPLLRCFRPLLLGLLCLLSGLTFFDQRLIARKICGDRRVILMTEPRTVSSINPSSLYLFFTLPSSSPEFSSAGKARLIFPLMDSRNLLRGPGSFFMLMTTSGLKVALSSSVIQSKHTFKY